jgi:AraC-like DNA-binding protein
MATTVLQSIHLPRRTRRGAEPASSRAIVQLREYLDAQCPRIVPLSEMCRVVAISPFHLVRSFRETVGLPPGAYLLRRRIERAQRLLASGMPISMVAQEAGFSDQSHLARHFKRIVGMTPGQYAKRALESR